MKMMLKTEVAVNPAPVTSHRINSTLSDDNSAFDQPCEKRFRTNSHGSVNECNVKYNDHNESCGSIPQEKTSFSMNVESRAPRDGPLTTYTAIDFAKPEAEQLTIIGTYSSVSCSSRFREMSAHRFGPNMNSTVIGVPLSCGLGVGTGVEVLESCQVCKLPICVFGRYLPCLHAPCLRCARRAFETTRQCATCGSFIKDVFHLPVGALLVCDIPSCRRTFRSLRDMRAHFGEMHRDGAEATNAEFLNEPSETGGAWNASADQFKPALANTPNHLLPSAPLLHTAFATNGCGFLQRDEPITRQPHVASHFHLVPAYSQQPFGHCIENGVRFASTFAEDSFRPPHAYGLGRFPTPAMAPRPSRLMHHSTMTMYPQASQSSPPLRPPPPLLRPFVGAYRPMQGPPFASRPAAPFGDTFQSDGYAQPFVNSPAFNGLPLQSVNNAAGHPWNTSNLSHSLF